ncbi:hypothetical protein EG328_004415 [Venturia inaequalis]|uniref:Rhodopsin domain-containing protein n=1 Tax=Venturia inaequalis TaxID=5025 RepID=A0A8H3YTY5_VENIN|nr:hypothetical protein EG328_004415 [Venturia inaequalis]
MTLRADSSTPTPAELPALSKNWMSTMPGRCQDRSIQTLLLYAVAFVAISTDWVFAILPIFLLWNVQLNWRVKGPVIIMLGLGIFASIAPIVRLKYLIGLNDRTRILDHLGNILVWASVEVNVGMFVANLPACRPILERAITRPFSRTGSTSNTRSDGKSRGLSTRKSRLDDNTSDQYVLDERPESSTLQDYLRNGHKSGNIGVHTTIYGDADEESSITMDHWSDISQRNMVRKASEDGRIHVNVQKDFTMEVTQEKFHPRTPE